MYRYYPPETKILRRPLSGSRPVTDCVEHVSRGWFPPNQIVLRKITRNIDSGYYATHGEDLVHDIQRDPALFTHCARSARKVMGAECKNFLRELKDLDGNALRTLVGVEHRAISSHHLRQATRLQGLRAKQSIESGAIARTLAPRVGVPEDDAVSSAFLRQLGFDLVAWNYPAIYSRAMRRSHENGRELGDLIEEMLGISPLQLARRISEGWPLPPEVRATIEPTDSHARPAIANTPFTERSEKLLQTVQISEILARARDPEHFPSAVRQWDVIAGEVEGLLGSSSEEALGRALDEIDRPLLAACPSAAPRIVRRPTLLGQVAFEEESSPFRNNLYATRCPPEVQAMMRTLYALAEHEDEDVSSDAIVHFVERVVPAAGFSSGCIFLGDSSALTIRPGLRIGEHPLSFYEGLTATSEDAIIEAMLGAASVARELTWRDGRRRYAILGGIGSPYRVGVLALELADEAAGLDGAELLTKFRALRHALEDILAIR